VTVKKMANENTKCGSCGMPLGEFMADGNKLYNYGFEKDGSRNPEYCIFCYSDGGFKEPFITMQKIMERSVENMIYELHIPSEKAVETAQRIIPHLKRWKKG
jgi:hypothetical protein